MTSISNPLLSLQSLLSGTTTSDSGGTPSLLDELAKNAAASVPSADYTAKKKQEDAFVMSLSDQAQEYLSSLSQLQGAVNKSDSSDDSKIDFGFMLSRAQLKTIGSIIDKYSDAPFTQQTYESIQQDLSDAGLSPDTLAIQDEMRSFNPTQIMIDALNGDGSELGQAQNFWDSSAEADKSQAYMEQIVKLWQDSSNTYHADSGTGGDDSVSSGS